MFLLNQTQYDGEETVLLSRGADTFGQLGQLVVPAETLQEFVLTQMTEHEKTREDTLLRKESWGNNLMKDGEEETERMRREEEKRRKISGGLIEVQVNCAQDLPQMDLFGTSDVFCEVF